MLSNTICLPNAAACFMDKLLPQLGLLKIRAFISLMLSHHYFYCLLRSEGAFYENNHM